MQDRVLCERPPEPADIPVCASTGLHKLHVTEQGGESEVRNEQGEIEKAV